MSKIRVPERVPVFSGTRVIEMADRARVRRLLGHPNSLPVVRRKDKLLVQINLLNHGDDSTYQPEHPRGNPRTYSHDHEMEDNPRGVWKLRHLRTDTGPLYRLSVTDCLTTK